jgi:hypothetical protein
MDLSRFVLKDLNARKFAQIEVSEMSSRFASREEAEENFLLAQALDDYQCVRTLLKRHEPYDWFKTRIGSFLPKSISAKGRYASLSNKLARDLEREGEIEKALEVYACSDEPPSRERRVRLLHKLEKTESAQRLVQEILAAPKNADERFFALHWERMLIRKRALRLTKLRLKAATKMDVPGRWRGNPEEGVMQVLTAQGFRCSFTENKLWQSLFGLLFWPVLYDPTNGAFHHPLQAGPANLRSRSFVQQKVENFTPYLSLLETETGFLDHIERIYYENYQTMNPLVRWEIQTLREIADCRADLGAAPLKAVLEEMLRDPRHNLSGFPDLLVRKTGELRFIEVKSPQDELSPQQLHWLNFFDQHGIPAEVIHIRWQA